MLAIYTFLIKSAYLSRPLLCWIVYSKRSLSFMVRDYTGGQTLRNTVGVFGADACGKMP